MGLMNEPTIDFAEPTIDFAKPAPKLNSTPLSQPRMTFSLIVVGGTEILLCFRIRMVPSEGGFKRSYK